MRLLRSYGLAYKPIAQVCEVSWTTVLYHLSPKEHANKLKRERERCRTVSAQQYNTKRQKTKEYQKWMREYMHDRYHNDSEFRRKMIRANSGGRFAEK